MLDTHLSHVIEVADAVLTSELTHFLDMLRRLNVLVWYKVVHNQCHLVLLEILPYKDIAARQLAEKARL